MRAPRPRAPSPGKHDLELAKRRRDRQSRLIRRVPDNLQVRLDPDRGGELEGVECFEDMFVLMINGLARFGGLAPNEPDAQQIIAQPGDQPEVSERSVNQEASADLCRRVGGNLRAGEAETAKPGEGRISAELLLEIKAEPRLRRPVGLGNKGLDAVDAWPQTRGNPSARSPAPRAATRCSGSNPSRAGIRAGRCLRRRRTSRTIHPRAAIEG